MIFYKTSSFGNDFIEIDVADLPAGVANKGALAAEICDRQRGVGADGVVFYRAWGSMSINFEIFNRDGGEAELSGNGMAGLAAVLFQRRLAPSPLVLHAAIGTRRVELLDRRGPVFQLNVEIGRPDFSQPPIFPFSEGQAGLATRSTAWNFIRFRSATPMPSSFVHRPWPRPAWRYWGKSWKATPGSPSASTWNLFISAALKTPAGGQRPCGPQVPQWGQRPYGPQAPRWGQRPCGPQVAGSFFMSGESGRPWPHPRAAPPCSPSCGGWEWSVTAWTSILAPRRLLSAGSRGSSSTISPA